MEIILFIIGLALLIIGAEALVRGASRLAAMLNISPLVIGLTVVAFGTSSPEMAVSIHSALAGQADISLGNVVGSNICNVLCILGLSAAIAPLAVSVQLVRLDVPIMIGVSIITLFFGLNDNINRMEGSLLLFGFVGYTTFLIYQSRKQLTRANQTYINNSKNRKDRNPKHLILNVGLVVFGLSLLILGSRWLVNGAISIANMLGISALVIGLTIVAIGTSLPELATSVIASIRGERDIAVGNIVGSNIFNILVVLGLTGAVSPHGIHVSVEALQFDIPVMIVAAVACLPIFFTGHIIARWEGVLFIGYYIAYLIYLILESTSHRVLPFFSMLMLFFAIPLTLITLLIVTGREIRKKAKNFSE